MKWTCDCGKVRLSISPGQGTRLVCYCSSCRDFAERFDAGETLDAAGGADLYQTSPESVTIDQGRDNLAWIKLTQKGPVRWYATCCNTPMANTLTTRSIPFATILSANVDDKGALGPVIARVNRRDATAHITEDAGSSGKAIRAFFWRAVKSRLSGAYKRNPFFDNDGKLIASGETLHD